MKRTVKIDPYFEDQPEKGFIEDLKSPLFSEKPSWFGHGACPHGMADAAGLWLEDFPADIFDGAKDVLDPSAADFRRFARVFGIEGRRYPVRVVRAETPCFEAWRLRVTAGEAVIFANDTEGVRRALIHIEDEMRRNGGPWLALGDTEKAPRMKTRITRCFFSPINRPPKYGDELSDDIDYYPDEYLNRLMHDGVNAVWIYTRFSDLVYSSRIPGYGQGSEARIAKLNAVIKKCAGYGIRPYVFAIEPVALSPEESRLVGDVDGGGAYNGKRLFCVNSQDGRAFVRECGRRLFEACPGLGGFISITYGERPTSCSSAYASLPAIGYKRDLLCPRCKNLTPGQVLANAARALASGIHEANPNAEVVSWTYGHRLWPGEDIGEYVRRAPDDVALMQNFEELCTEEQLGKPRVGVDYWLSCPGPSPLFETTARAAKKYGKRLFMKTQVCCSHEVASVPYVPVPGILFDRYKAAYALGVEGVMQCWYFGNYPSLMSKAAGELAFWDDFTDKGGFLEHLAALYWGRERAKAVVRAWNAFEAGYRSLPLNIMFSYYGPMHDGPVWKLALKPKNFSLPRTWQTLDPTDGDRIGECLMSGHTLDEAITLTAAVNDRWQEGLACLNALDARDEFQREQQSVARALGLLFASGHDILRFYRLRQNLGYRRGDALDILRRMRAIVSAEIERSNALSALCENDARLGYHSEGEGYKYFPKKLKDRVDALKTLLADEFPEVEGRVKAGLSPLAYYDGEDDGAKRYTLAHGAISAAPWEAIGPDAAFRAACDRDTLRFEWRLPEGGSVIVDPEFELMIPYPTVELTAEGEVRISANTYLYYSVCGERIDQLKRAWPLKVVSRGGGSVTIAAELDRETIGWPDDRPMRMRFQVGDALWCADDDPVRTLGKSALSPGDFGWLLPPQD